MDLTIMSTSNVVESSYLICSINKFLFLVKR